MKNRWARRAIRWLVLGGGIAGVAAIHLVLGIVLLMVVALSASDGAGR
jgi:hypothetical protein